MKNSLIDYTPETIINKLKLTNENPTYFYTMGHCYPFAKALSSFFKGSVIMYDHNGGHMYVRIGDRLYDVNGKASLRKERKMNLQPANELKKPHRWSIRKEKQRMYDYSIGYSTPMYLNHIDRMVYREIKSIKKSLYTNNLPTELIYFTRNKFLDLYNELYLYLHHRDLLNGDECGIVKHPLFVYLYNKFFNLFKQLFNVDVSFFICKHTNTLNIKDSGDKLLKIDVDGYDLRTIKEQLNKTNVS